LVDGAAVVYAILRFCRPLPITGPDEAAAPAVIIIGHAASPDEHPSLSI
jgi:hypothetical protein